MAQGKQNSRKRASWRRRQAGSAMLELAVGFPVLLLVLLGIADFGRIFYTSIAVNNAARAAVQWAISSPTRAHDVAGMTTAAQNDAPSISGLTVTPTQWCQCGTTTVACTTTCTGGGIPQAYVKVVTQATYSTLVPYWLIPNSTNVVGKVIMRTR